LDIRYEDDDVLVVNKPVGMVIHPAVGNRTGTLLNALLGLAAERAVECNLERAGIIHRLDKNTSGLLIVARNEKAARYLQAQLKERKIKRAYLALVCGHLKNDQGEINAPIGRSIKDRKKMAVTNVASREALTQYQALERYESHTLLRISLITGRTHQIRVHLAHLGHPVFGDPDYGGREKWHKGIFAPQRRLSQELLKDFNRQALHAYKIAFEHPVTGKQVEIIAEPPEDFARLLRKLGSEFIEKGLNLD
ncbi:MAG: RluA family pseudouridine synthase, partial [candidate division Zixibacteria bacterium]|nr:RluA family pseudouridine synthase [candidate division Zixibacteria bacterium]